MKKLLFLAIIAAFIVAMTSVAFAGYGVHLGPGYASDTDACAGCHRAHTSASPIVLASWAGKYALLTSGPAVTTTEGFCYSCHGQSASGAYTDVEYGRFVTAGRSGNGTGTVGGTLLGGGFTKLGGTANTDSKHNVEATGTVWGEGPSSSGPGQSLALYCTNCHDPHGTANYRILIHDPDGDSTDVTVASNEGSEHNFTNTGNYKNKMSDWCTTCHEQYMTYSGTPYNAGDGQGVVTRYRHVMGTNITTYGDGTPYDKTLTTTLPLENDSGGTSNALFCVTCHRAHGSQATMSGRAAGVQPAQSATILRLNNRGVCEDCHAK